MSKRAAYSPETMCSRSPSFRQPPAAVVTYPPVARECGPTVTRVAVVVVVVVVVFVIYVIIIILLLLSLRSSRRRFRFFFVIFFCRRPRSPVAEKTRVSDGGIIQRGYSQIIQRIINFQGSYYLKQNMWFFLLIISSFYIWTCDGLTVKAVVPRYKIRGETAVLRCDYELEGAVLYAVKWYRENEEFYRYVLKSDPQKTSYVVDGIKVDHMHSNSRQLTLRDITLKTTANYRCEVSAEAPSFASAQDGGRMEVIYLPKDGPYITGDKSIYQFGDTINLNCTSAKSYPASSLHWFINNISAREESLKRYPAQKHPRGLVTTTLGLHLPLDAETVLNGAVRVRCVAVLSPVLWTSDNEKVLPRQDKREALLLVTGSSSECNANRVVVFLFLLLIHVFF